MIVPNLITTLDGKEVMVDFFTAEVTQNRTIHIIGEINDDTASYICSEIRYLSRNSKEPLTLILNSPGGSISAGHGQRAFHLEHGGAKPGALGAANAQIRVNICVHRKTSF